MSFEHQTEAESAAGISAMMDTKTMTPRECPVAHYHMPRTCAAGMIETCPNRVPSSELHGIEKLGEATGRNQTMSEYSCYLITLYVLQSGVSMLIRIALESKEDYEYWQEPDVRAKLNEELPEYIRHLGGVVVNVESIYEIIPRKESK